MTPNGCTHCGIEQRLHARRWAKAAGWHGYTPPTDAQRLERMQARRAPAEAASTTEETP